MNSKISFLKYLIFFILPTFTGIVAFIYTQPYKLGTGSDSYRYISMAKHLAQGQGIAIYNKTTQNRSYPETNFAPLYPAILSLFIYPHDCIQDRLWIFQILLLWLLIFLAGLTVKWFTNSWFFAFLGQLIYAVDIHFLTFIHMALTEGLFLFLVHLAILFLYFYFSRQKLSFLILASFVFSLTILTRYIGIACLPFVFLAILLFDVRPIVQRILRALLSLIIIGIPITLWMIRNFFLTRIAYEKGVPGGYPGQYFFKDVFLDVWHNLTLYPVKMYWYSENACLSFFLFACFMLLIFFILYRYRTPSNRLSSMSSLLLILYPFCYVLTLGLVLTWRNLNAMTDNVRYLIPFYYFFWLFLVTGAYQLHGAIKIRLPRSLFLLFQTVVLFVICVLFFRFAALTTSWWTHIHQRGIDGKQNKEWAFILDEARWFPDPPYK